jgi:hypothetical protein
MSLFRELKLKSFTIKLVITVMVLTQRLLLRMKLARVQLKRVTICQMNNRCIISTHLKRNVQAFLLTIKL